MDKAELKQIRDHASEGGALSWDVTLKLLDHIDALEKPVDMRLFCPQCHQQHIDKAEEFNGNQTNDDEAESQAYREWLADGPWLNPPHKSHKCEYCDCIWRPADVATNGVDQITTKGKNDTWIS